MKISPQQYAQSLFDAISETNPKDHDLIMDNFVKILAKNGDLDKYPEIEKEFRSLQLKDKGIKEAEITLARPHEVSHEIVQELNKIIGNKVEVKTKIDENLIGGVVVRVDDQLIDASVKKQLENLNQSLKS